MNVNAASLAALIDGRTVDLFTFAKSQEEKVWSRTIFDKQLGEVGIPPLLTGSLHAKAELVGSWSWNLRGGIDTRGLWFGENSGATASFAPWVQLEGNAKVLGVIKIAKVTGRATFQVDASLRLADPSPGDGKVYAEEIVASGGSLTRGVLNALSASLKGGIRFDVAATAKIGPLKKTVHFDKYVKLFNFTRGPRFAGGDTAGDQPVVPAAVRDGVLTITGTDENDYVRLTPGTDQVVVRTVSRDAAGKEVVTDRAFSGVKRVRFTGGAGDDTLDAGALAIPVEADGGLDADTLIGGSAADRLTDGSGDDEDTLIGGGGNDTLIGGGGADVLTGGDGNDAITDTAGDNTLSGGDGNDTITDGAGGSRLDAGDGDDVVSAGDGDNVADLGAGNDRYTGGAGMDTVDGGLGNDTIAVGGGVDAAAPAPYTDASGEEFVTLPQPANVATGGAGNDVLTGGDARDLLQGDAGNDTLTGGGSDDMLFGGDGDDSVAGGAGDDALTGDDGIDTLAGDDGNDALSGGAGNDALTGGRGADVLVGGSGTNRLDGGAGDDTIVQAPAVYGGGVGDKIIGGVDADTLEVIGTPSDDAIGVRQTGTDRFVVSFKAPDESVEAEIAIAIGADVERLAVNGGDGNDTITGDAKSTRKLVLDGGEGDDTLRAGGGADTLLGGAGRDRLFGGAGTNDLQGEEGDDTLDGGLGSDNLGGGAGNDTLSGGGGHDVMSGGSGNDTLVAGPGVYGVIASGDDGDDTLVGGDGVDVLFGGNGDDLALGGPRLDVIDGGAGNDRLAGETGRDFIFGGDGNDTLRAFDATVWRQAAGLPAAAADLPADWLTQYGTFLEAETEVFNRLKALDAKERAGGLTEAEREEQQRLSDHLVVLNLDEIDVVEYQHVQVDVLWGGAGGDTLTGSPYADILIGDTGDDRFEHTAGNDTVQGGDDDPRSIDDGNDLYVVSGTAGADKLVVRYDAAADQVYVEVNGVGTRVSLPGIEVAGVNALAGHDRLTIDFQQKAAMKVSANGGDGNDHLDASTSQAAVQLYGDDGNDTLIGGMSDDILVGGGGNDTLTGGAEYDRLYGGEGHDRLYGGTGNDVLKGEAGDDVAEGGEGNDYVAGYAGDDLLSGGDGNDTLTGGEGHDRVNGDRGDDVVEGDVGEDTLTGGEGNDRLNGGDGNDFLDGNEGVDAISGGGGSDTLNYSEDAHKANGVYESRDSYDGGTGTDRLRVELGAEQLVTVFNRVVRFASSNLDISNRTGVETLDIISTVTPRVYRAYGMGPKVWRYGRFDGAITVNGAAGGVSDLNDPLEVVAGAALIPVLPGEVLRFDSSFGSNWEQDVDIHDDRTGARVQFWNNYYGGPGSWTYENNTSEVVVLRVSALHKRAPRAPGSRG